jgi:carboxylesterase type B
MHFRVTLVLYALLSLCCDVHAVSNSTAPTVKTLNGTYAGKYLDSWDQDAFLGIPYAQPPVGPLRFKWPQILDESFSETRDASQYGYSCYQYGTKLNLSEDCLTINGNLVTCLAFRRLTWTVIRPSGHTNEKVPVLVWIYGGGWTLGSTADPQYNLSGIVRNAQDSNNPIIAVSMNYRLGMTPADIKVNV